jgi:hypothetical protein
VLVRVTDFRVVLDGRTGEERPVAPQLTLARLAAKGIKSTPIPRDMSKKHLQGSVYLRMVYGPPDEPPVRQYILRLSIQVAFASEAEGSMSDDLIEETDVPLGSASL